MRKRRTEYRNQKNTPLPFALCPLLFAILLLLPQVKTYAANEWRVMPIRSEQEYNQGKIGGEAEQHLHGIARCRTHPDIIYLSHDVGSVWKSINGGDSWRKTTGKNLYLNFGQSIEVDPINPDIVFVVLAKSFNWLVDDKYRGIYRSKDGGESWDLVKTMNVSHKGRYQHTLEYDPASIDGTKALRWYAASPKEGLLRSDDGGDTWTESLGLKQVKNINVTTQGSYNSSWPPKLMFNNNYQDTSVLAPLTNFKIIYTLNAPTVLQRLELYQGDWKDTYDYAKDLLIEFGDGTSLTATLEKKPFQKQTINLNNKLTDKVTITVTSIYDNANQSVNWGGFAEIELIDSTGQDVTIWDEGITEIYDIECDPKDGKTVYAATNKGLFKSTVQGALMQTCGNLPSDSVTSVEINPQDTNEIYVTLRSDGLYRSSDGGTTFVLLKKFDAAYVFMNSGFPKTLYLVGVSANTITTHDGGLTWITDMITIPAPGLGRSGSSWKGRIAGGLTGIVPNPENESEAVAYARGTLWKTTDGGKTFIDSSTLFTGFAWSWWNDGLAFDMFDPTRFATFNCDVGMAITNTASDYFELRNAQAWQWYNQGLIGWFGTYAGDFQPVKESAIMVASVGNYFKTQLMRSADEGKTWVLVTQGADNVQYNLFIAFHPVKTHIVFAGNKVSYDAGVTFTKIDFGAFNQYNPSILGMCYAVPDTLYALDSSRQRIIRSDDCGQTWYLYNQPGWCFTRLDPLPTFAADPVDPNKIYTLDKNYNVGIYNGKEWKSGDVLTLAGGKEFKNFVRGIAVDPRKPEIIYATTFAAGFPCVFRSRDGGTTWQDITYNLPLTGYGPIAVSPHSGEVFIGNGCGTRVLPPPYESKTFIYDKLPRNNPQVIYGDINADSQISAYDAALTAQAAVGLIILTAEQTKKADVSGDSEVTAYDAALIAQYSVGLISKFPVEL